MILAEVLHQTYSTVLLYYFGLLLGINLTQFGSE